MSAERCYMATGQYKALRGHHTSEQLSWLPNCFQAQFKLLILTFNALHSLGQEYLKDPHFPYAHTLRSNEAASLQVPPLVSVHWIVRHERTISALAPRIPNTLDMRLGPSLSL